MGQESERDGGYIFDVNDADAPSTPSAENDGRNEIQSMSVGGEGGSQECGSDIHTIEPSQLGSEAASADREWIVVQLRDQPDRLLVVDVVEEFSYALFGDKSAEMQFHFPAARDGEVQRDNPLANYVFVCVNLDDVEILKLEQSRMVDVVLCTAGSAGRWRKVIKVHDDEVIAMANREDTSDVVSPGDRVLVEDGNWSGLYGVAVDAFGDKLKVAIELHSRTRIVTLNREDVKRVIE